MEDALEKRTAKEISRRGFIQRALYGALGLCATVGIDKLSGFGLITENPWESSLEKKIQDEYKIRVIGNTSEEKIETLAYVLGICDKTLDNFRDHLGKVRKIKFSRFNLYNDCGAAGELTKTVILHNIDCVTLIHEIGHIWYSCLENKNKFNKQWKEIAQVGYGTFHSRLVRCTQIAMKNGSFTEYALTSLKEDVATFCDEVYKIKSWIRKYGEFVQLREWKADPRYIQKFALLKDYGFITKDEFEQLKPYFSCEGIKKHGPIDFDGTWYDKFCIVRREVTDISK